MIAIGPFEASRVGIIGSGFVARWQSDAESVGAFGRRLTIIFVLLSACGLWGSGAAAEERVAGLDVRSADGSAIDPSLLMDGDELREFLSSDLLQAATIDASVLPFDLPPGASVTIVFEVTVDNPPASPGNTQIDNLAQATGANFTTVESTDPGNLDADAATDTNLLVQADLAVTKSDGVMSAVPGGQVVYTIVAANSGPTAVTDAAVVDNFPASLTCSWTSLAAGGATGHSNSSGDLADVLSMPASSQVTYTVTCDIDPATRGTLMNTATILSMATSDPVPGNNSASDNDTVLTPDVDLSIVKTDSADPVPAASGYSYTLQVSNGGPSSALSVQAVDTLPSGVMYVGFAGTNWSCVEAPSGTITCDLGVAIAPASSAPNLVINVTAPDEGGVVTNNATGTSTEDMLGVSTMENTTITAATSLAISKTDSADPVDAASAFQYTIVATNNGPSTATSVEVVDTLPAGLVFDGKNAASTEWTCVEAPAGTVTCDLTGSLASSTSAQNLIFDVTAPSAGGLIVNNAAVTSAENGTGASTLEDTTVSAAADLSVTKDDSVADVPVGGSLTYTIVVTNSGPSDDPSVAFADTFPVELINCSWTSLVTGGATGNSSAAGAAIMDTLDMPASSTVTYTVDCDIDPLTLSPDVTNTATATASVSDPVAGNNSDSDTDTILFDTDPPAVVRVDSSPDTGDGEVTECEQVAVELADLLVVFDEAMAVSPAAGAADDASNFLLVEAGADGDYQTDFCGVPGGDDQAVAPVGVTLDVDTPVPPQSTSTLAFGSLADGLYRLIACSTLTDEAGNALDGGAFVRDFRLEAGNLFVNGHFDCGDAGWHLGPTAVSWDGTVDQDSSAASGSETVDSGGVEMALIAQCVPLAGSASPSGLDAAMSLSAAPGVQVVVDRFCDFFSAPTCEGILLGVSGSGVILEDSGGTFVEGSAGLIAPVGSVSALCGVEVLSPGAETFQLWLDGLHLDGSGTIFSDGFELGDTSRWSITVP